LDLTLVNFNSPLSFLITISSSLTSSPVLSVVLSLNETENENFLPSTFPFSSLVSPNITKFARKIKNINPTPRSITHKNPINILSCKLRPNSPNDSRNPPPSNHKLNGEEVNDI
jgi:hypothetical protein